MRIALLLLITVAVSAPRLTAQPASSDTLYVTLIDETGEPLPFASVGIPADANGTSTDLDGRAQLVLPKGYPATIRISSTGYGTLDTTLLGAPRGSLSLKPSAYALGDIVVTGTLAPTRRLDSPVPVEVYTRTFLLSDPVPSLFDAIQNVNGVRPQLNCSVCNTGDIHINGLEGPYTMVTIDGMPIVSGLASVYGLTGIPTSMIERVEIVKGPAGSLYGSEAVGGLINVITRDASRAPRFSVDAFSTTLGDVTLDLGVSTQLGKHVRSLTGVNGYFYENPVDANNDNFTDMTLAQRISVFQKFQFASGRFAGLDVAARGLLESRYGGELGFDPAVHRGGTEYYGESIDTRRVELLTKYAPESVPGLTLSGSANVHVQRSDYGDTKYDAEQAIGFAQAVLARRYARHNVLYGVTTRYTYYDDDTFATEENGTNQPDRVLLPGAFVQDEWINGRHRILAGLRYDHDPRHGSIWTPRAAYKAPLGEGANIRFNVGTGFRVVNLFTEDHAALSGARTVVIDGELNPERSVSGNINVDKRWAAPRSGGLTWAVEASTWLTRFSNQILPDYESDVTEIRYANLKGHSRSQGASAEVRTYNERLNASVGMTFTDVAVIDENDAVTRPLLSERWSGVWNFSYEFSNQWSANYTGSLYGPMLLPVQSELDDRPGESPWFSLQNVQTTYRLPNGQWEVYGGIKNLLNFRPDARSIARSFDPFDRQVSFNAAGDAVTTPDNPGALVFDPSYVYASNVGRRVFVGLRYTLN